MSNLYFRTKLSRNSERGNMLIIWAAIIGIAWLIISWIIGLIYDTKETRVDKDRNRNIKGTTLPFQADPDNYQVTY